mmetsp:Transcript_30680/g.107879  ORF Transcript_30680/g.107879 Transcript_30680/m.107879 type:complete len:146 (-) Transcript_30680:5-442(-)
MPRLLACAVAWCLLGSCAALTGDVGRLLARLAPSDGAPGEAPPGRRRGRIYANASKLERAFGDALTRDELFATDAPPVRQDRYTAWISAPYRLGVLAACYTAYPHLIAAMDAALPTEPNQVAAAVSSGLVPAVSLLYGSRPPPAV